MKKILIVGATGFIGRNLYDFFENKGEYETTALKRSDVDLYDEEAVENYLKEHFYDIIFYCVNDSHVRNTEIGYKDMVYYNLRMVFNFEKCQKYYGKLFYLGSGAEYDKKYDIINVSENKIGEHIPTDEYGLYKYTVNKIIQFTGNWYNLRLFGIFGRYEDWRAKYISGLCCKAIKGLPLTIRQNTLFDYLWIEDFCRIAEILIEKDLVYRDMNIVSGNAVSLVELAELVRKISGKELPVYIAKEGMANIYTASNERMLKQIGDFKYTDIETSVKKLYEWYEDKADSIDIYPLLYQ